MCTFSTTDDRSSSKVVFTVLSITDRCPHLPGAPDSEPSDTAVNFAPFPDCMETLVWIRQRFTGHSYSQLFTAKSAHQRGGCCYIFWHWSRLVPMHHCEVLHAACAV